MNMANLGYDELEGMNTLARKYSIPPSVIGSLLEEGHSLEDIDEAYELRDLFPTNIGEESSFDFITGISKFPKMRRLGPKIKTLLRLIESFPGEICEEDLLRLNREMNGNNYGKKNQQVQKNLQNNWDNFLVYVQERGSSSFQESVDSYIQGNSLDNDSYFD